MTWVDTHTQRTLVVSMCRGPAGRTLGATDYVAWLDRGGWRDDSLEEAELPEVERCRICRRQWCRVKAHR